MRGVYVANVGISGLAAAKTLIYITAPADKVVEILEAHVTNENLETNEQLRCCLQRVSTLGTPTATTLTPAKEENGDQAAGSTVKGDVTAGEPTYTANSEVGYEGFPSLSGWHYEPRGEGMFIPGQGTVGLRILDAPTAFNCRALIRFREIG